MMKCRGTSHSIGNDDDDDDDDDNNNSVSGSHKTKTDRNPRRKQKET